jgi:hypothetical protein
MATTLQGEEQVEKQLGQTPMKGIYIKRKKKSRANTNPTRTGEKSHKNGARQQKA